MKKNIPNALYVFLAGGVDDGEKGHEAQYTDAGGLSITLPSNCMSFAGIHTKEAALGVSLAKHAIEKKKIIRIAWVLMSEIPSPNCSR